MQQLPDALAPMAAYRQFIVCLTYPDPQKPGKTLKLPVDVRTGKTHNAHDPNIWLDAAYACQVASAWEAANGGANDAHYFVGFVFTEHDPFFFVDIDQCAVVNPDGNVVAWSPIVHELCAALPGAAVEVSQSQRGLHIFGTGTAPAERRKKDYTNKLFDLYTEERFVCLTGFNLVGSVATVHTAALHALTEKWLKRQVADAGPDVWTTEPCATWRGPTDDAQLLDRALRSSSAAAAFGGKASFADLWNCNVPALERTYPPDPNGTLTYGASEADRALAQHLAFWTGKDCARIERLMRLSGLRREKWDREDYVTRTILSAVAQQREVLADRPAEPLPGAAVPLPADVPEPAPVTGNTFLNLNEQIDTLRGCVYVLDQHKVFTPKGGLMKPEQFKASYGGYQWPMDPANTKVSRDAWEALTQSQYFRAPRADSSCFRPDLPFGSLVDYEGLVKVNVYQPVNVRRFPGDATPFIQHLEKLIPDPRDRQILLSYMAACVQYKGVKFKWAPLIQGVEGNGKSLLSQCVAYSVGRRYAHWPRADQITEKFNGWLFGNLFIGVEDIYVPHQRNEIIEILKPMITGDNLEKRGMGVEKMDAETCANFMLNSNHKDALRKLRNDRRFGIFFCAQQEAAHLKRDGLTEAYFRRFVAWLKADGFAIVAELLATMPIADEFNPATGQRAPTTSSTEEAIAQGLGRIEQEVLEAIDQGKMGFRGGWISSFHLDHLLERIGSGRTLAPNKRREMLAQLGYDWHPNLPAGRVNSIVTEDGGTKPRLYIQRTSALAGLDTPAGILRAYLEAQKEVPHAEPVAA